MARINWAKNMIIQPDMWSQIVFSDEKKFNLDGPNGLRHTGVMYAVLLDRRFAGRMEVALKWFGVASAGRESRN
ncbi:hypothetical protein PI125_g6968 [Phytophthora idaei]|nr:hypothetical protein PI125_g6968 [Phytophthora idaei]KAG3173188.1 hypothetical protein PI126_g1002 [Phytophthora idaei]